MTTRDGTLTVLLNFRDLPDGMPTESYAGEPVIKAGETVDISPICDSRQAKINMALVGEDLKSVTSTAEIIIPASVDSYNVRFKRSLMLAVMHAATTRSVVRAWISYKGKALFTGVLDLKNLDIESTGRYQGGISLTVKDDSYMLDEKIARSVEIPDNPVRDYVSGSTGLEGVFYYDDTARKWYTWDGAKYVEKTDLKSDESPFFPASASVRVWNKNAPEVSAVGVLLKMAGYTVANGLLDAKNSDSCTDDIRLFAYDTSEDKTYRDVLDTLLKEHCLCLTTTPEGAVVIRSLLVDDVAPKREIGVNLKDGSPVALRDGIKTGFEVYAHDGLKLTYSSSLAVRRQQNVFSDQVGGDVGDDGSLSGTAIAPQSCYPTDGDITATYQEYSASFLDRAYTTKESRKQNEDLSIVSTRGAYLEVAEKGASWQPSTKLEYPKITQGESAEFADGANPYFTPKKAQVLLYNPLEKPSSTDESAETENEGKTIHLQILNVVADVLYREHTSVAYCPSAVADPEEYTATYIFTKAQAEKYASFFVDWMQDSRMQTDWVEYGGDFDNLGTIVGYQHTESPVSSYCMVSKLTLSMTGSAEKPFRLQYHGIGVRPYAAKPLSEARYTGKDSSKGQDGRDGKQGEKGKDGVSMKYWYASAPEGLYPGGCPFGTDQNAIGIADTAIGINDEWHDTVPDIADGYVLWTKTVAPDGTVSIYRVQGPKGDTGAQGPTGATGATGRGISGITEYYLASASSTAPSASDTGWSTSAQTPTTAKPYLWNKTVVTYTSGSPTTTIAMIGQSIKGETGDPGPQGEKGSAPADFSLALSSPFFSVSPRGVAHATQIISVVCTRLNSDGAITWSIDPSDVITTSVSEDSTVLTLTCTQGTTPSAVKVTCTVVGIGSKTTDVIVVASGADAPIYLGTDWDETRTTTIEGDPLKYGDYYLRLSDTMVRVYSGTEWRDVSAATSTHQMMQDALSDVLKHGADVKQSSSVLYAYVGNLVAQSASIKALSTEVITSANYAEDSSGLPVAGYKLDGPNNLIKSYGMQGYNSQFHDISIKGGHITINDESQNPVFVTNEADQGTEINATGDAPAYYDIDEFIEGLPKNSLQDETISASKDGNTLPYDGYYINDTDETVNVQAVPSDSSYAWTQSITMTVTKVNSNGTKYDAFGTASYSGKNTVNLFYIMPRSTGKLTVSIKNSAGTEICRVTRTTRNGYSFSNYFSQGDVETETGLNPASASGNFTYNFTFEMTNISGFDAVGSTFGVKFDCEMRAAYSNTLGAKRIGFVSRSYTNTSVLYRGYYGYFSLGKKYLGTSAPITIGTRKTSDYLNYGLASSFISKLTAGTYQVNADKPMLYQDGETSRSTMSVVAVTATSLDITSTQGGVRYTSTDYIKGTPKIRFTPVSTLKGATVLNLNAATDTSQIGSAVQKFANVWADNLNNNAVTDSANPTLSVSGATSIVGAINQINRDLAKKVGFTFKQNIIRDWSNGTGGSEVTYDCIANNYLPNDSSRQYVVIGEMSGYDTHGHRANIQSDVMRTATGVHANTSSGDYPYPSGVYSQSGNDSHRQFAITFVMPVDRYIYYTSWTAKLMITLFGYFVF